MVISQTELKSEVIELSTKAFETFYKDISDMFSVKMGCVQKEVSEGTIDDIRKHFGGFIAVNTVKAEGTLDGSFQLIFDQEGLSTLAGVIIMLPEQQILENRKNNSVEYTKELSDALGEVGNLLVGAWDRVFRENMEGHDDFAQTNSFIGEPWDEPGVMIGLSENTELVLVSYEMTLGSSPACNCGVIFPKTLLGETSETDTQLIPPEQETTTEEEASAEQKVPAEEEASAEKQAPVKKKAPPEEKASAEKQASVKKKASPKEKASAEKQAPVKKKASSKEKASAEKQAPVKKKASSKEKASAEKQAPVKKKASSKEKASAEKQASVKKKAPPEEKASAEKQAPVKKKASSKEKASAEKQAPVKKKASPKEKASAEKQAPVEQEATTEEEPSAEKQTPVEQEAVTEEEPSAEKQTPVEQEAVTEEEPSAEKQTPVEQEAVTKEEPSDEQQPPVEEKAPPEEEPSAEQQTPAEKVEEKTAVAEESKESAGGVISETIRRMTQSSPEPPTEDAPSTMVENQQFSTAGVSSAACAKDIMQKEVVWGSADDNVQQALTKMQQADSGYMMIGEDGAPEGIVSKSDITGAISPYLRPIFAKWHRPLDDATLQIKVKWIMSRPVHTVKPETSLVNIMGTMRQFGLRALPVMDQQGNIQGIVTVFDIFKAMISEDSEAAVVGKTSQAPPLA